jgi:hypothetical protein
MPTLRQRFRDYRATESDYPDTPEDFEVSRRRAIAGAVLAGGTGFVCAAPFGWALLMAANSGLIPHSVAAVVGLGIYFIAGRFVKYVGGPLADHVLGIPREVKG